MNFFLFLQAGHDKSQVKATHAAVSSKVSFSHVTLLWSQLSLPLTIRSLVPISPPLPILLLQSHTRTIKKKKTEREQGNYLKPNKAFAFAPHLKMCIAFFGKEESNTLLALNWTSPYTILHNGYSVPKVSFSNPKGCGSDVDVNALMWCSHSLPC